MNQYDVDFSKLMLTVFDMCPSDNCLYQVASNDDLLLHWQSSSECQLALKFQAQTAKKEGSSISSQLSVTSSGCCSVRSKKFQHECSLCGKMFGKKNQLGGHMIHCRKKQIPRPSALPHHVSVDTRSLTDSIVCDALSSGELQLSRTSECEVDFSTLMLSILNMCPSDNCRHHVATNDDLLVHWQNSSECQLALKFQAQSAKKKGSSITSHLSVTSSECCSVRSKQFLHECQFCGKMFRKKTQVVGHIITCRKKQLPPSLEVLHPVSADIRSLTDIIVCDAYTPLNVSACRSAAKFSDFDTIIRMVHILDVSEHGFSGYESIAYLLYGSAAAFEHVVNATLYFLSLNPGIFKNYFGTSEELHEYISRFKNAVTSRIFLEKYELSDFFLYVIGCVFDINFVVLSPSASFSYSKSCRVFRHNSCRQTQYFIGLFHEGTHWKPILRSDEENPFFPVGMKDTEDACVFDCEPIDSYNYIDESLHQVKLDFLKRKCWFLLKETTIHSIVQPHSSLNEGSVELLERFVISLDCGGLGFCGYKCVARLVYDNQNMEKKLMRVLLQFLRINEGIYNAFKVILGRDMLHSNFCDGFSANVHQPVLLEEFWFDNLMIYVVACVFNVNVISIFQMSHVPSRFFSRICF
jgi:hypothetical protein